MIMQRRDALASLMTSGAGLLLGACSSPPASSEGPSEAQIGVLLQQLTGYTLRPGEGAKVQASLDGNRFTAAVDPTIQPQSDFDPDIDV
jgi:hypothetical protein